MSVLQERCGLQLLQTLSRCMVLLEPLRNTQHHTGRSKGNQAAPNQRQRYIQDIINIFKQTKPGLLALQQDGAGLSDMRVHGCRPLEKVPNPVINAAVSWVLVQRVTPSCFFPSLWNTQEAA